MTHSSSYKHAEYTPVSRASVSLVEAVQKASQRSGEGVNFSGTPLVTLTARQPYDPVAWLDFYKPGRWDTTYQDILMDSIVQGSSGRGVGGHRRIRNVCPTRRRDLLLRHPVLRLPADHAAVRAVGDHHGANRDHR